MVCARTLPPFRWSNFFLLATKLQADDVDGQNMMGSKYIAIGDLDAYRIPVKMHEYIEYIKYSNMSHLLEPSAQIIFRAITTLTLWWCSRIPIKYIRPSFSLDQMNVNYALFSAWPIYYKTHAHTHTYTETTCSYNKNNDTQQLRDFGLNTKSRNRQEIVVSLQLRRTNQNKPFHFYHTTHWAIYSCECVCILCL